MKSFESIIFVVLIFLIIFTGMITVGVEIMEKNPNLDEDSIGLIGNLTGELNINFNASQLGPASSNLTANGTFEGQDPFTLQFLEGKTDAQKQLSLAGKIKRIPEIIILSLGVDRDDLSMYLTFIFIILGLFVAFASYRAFFGGGKLTDN